MGGQGYGVRLMCLCGLLYPQTNVQFGGGGDMLTTGSEDGYASHGPLSPCPPVAVPPVTTPLSYQPILAFCLYFGWILVH